MIRSIAKRGWVGGLVCGALASIAAGPALAQGNPAASYPDHQVSFIVPLPPGGVADLQARLLAEHLRGKWNQPFVIDNRPGGGTSIGMAVLAKSKPDGYTIGLGNNASTVILPLLKADMPYDAIKDFAPVSLMNAQGAVILANPKRTPISSFPELLAAARANPGKLIFGSTGLGGGTHLSMELLMAKAGIKMIHSPYKGSTQQMQDLLGQQIDFAVDIPTTAWAQVRSGELRAVGSLGSRRASFTPDLPAAKEFVPGAEFTIWNGVMAPAGTPRPIVDKLSAEVRAFLSRPDIIKRLTDQGVEPVGNTPEEFARAIAEDRARLKPVIDAAGIKLED